MSKILIVDDDSMIREMLGDFLADDGHEVQLAASAEEALHLIDTGLKFDVLITDMCMPGLSGEQLVARLRGRGCQQKLIVISGRVGLSSVPGADDVITKPFHWDVLQRAVKVLS